MQNKAAAHFMIRLPGLERTVGDLRITEDKLIRIDFPSALGPRQIELMQNDLAILADITRSNNLAVQEILHAVSQNDLTKAQTLAATIGLTEENLAKRGGQQEGLIVIVILAVILLAECVGGSATPVSPEPVGRGNRSGAANAGTDGG